MVKVLPCPLCTFGIGAGSTHYHFVDGRQVIYYRNGKGKVRKHDGKKQYLDTGSDRSIFVDAGGSDLLDGHKE